MISREVYGDHQGKDKSEHQGTYEISNTGMQNHLAPAAVSHAGNEGIKAAVKNAATTSAKKKEKTAPPIKYYDSPLVRDALRLRNEFLEAEARENGQTTGHEKQTFRHNIALRQTIEQKQSHKTKSHVKKTVGKANKNKAAGNIKSGKNGTAEDIAANGKTQRKDESKPTLSQLSETDQGAQSSTLVVHPSVSSARVNKWKAAQALLELSPGVRFFHQIGTSGETHRHCYFYNPSPGPKDLSRFDELSLSADDIENDDEVLTNPIIQSDANIGDIVEVLGDESSPDIESGRGKNLSQANISIKSELENSLLQASISKKRSQFFEGWNGRGYSSPLAALVAGQMIKDYSFTNTEKDKKNNNIENDNSVSDGDFDELKFF